MSGLYVQGVEPFERCDQCPCYQLPFEHGELGWCIPMDRQVAANIPPLDCPAIETGNHGKLIDADKLIARLERERTIILHELPGAHAREDGYTKEDYIFERNGDMISMLRNQAAVIPSDFELLSAAKEESN